MMRILILFASCVLVAFARVEVQSVQKCESARAQLEYAGKRKLDLRGTHGTDREAARERAVVAYRAVHYHFPRELAARAEAAFRAGELLRAGKRAKEARLSFEDAAQLGAGTEYRARGWLQVGHGYRRAHRMIDALGAYEKVALDPDAAPRHRDRALLWRARLQARLGRGKEARASWERVARKGFDSFDRVEAFDSWALHLIEHDDLEGAAGVLALCGELLAERLLEETRTGDRLRKVHAKMRSVPRLKSAVEARRKSRRETARMPSRGVIRVLEGREHSATRRVAPHLSIGVR